MDYSTFSAASPATLDTLSAGLADVASLSTSPFLRSSSPGEHLPDIHVFTPIAGSIHNCKAK